MAESVEIATARGRRETEGKRQIEQALVLSSARHGVSNLGFSWKDLEVASILEVTTEAGTTHALRLSNEALASYASTAPPDLLAIVRQAHPPLPEIVEAESSRPAILAPFDGLDVILLCGNYGSGKSHFARKYFTTSGRRRVNHNALRRLLYEMGSFGQHWEASSFVAEDEQMVTLLETRLYELHLDRSDPLLVDNTCLTAEARRGYVAAARRWRRSIGAILLATPTAVCLRRNRSRGGSAIPEAAIRNLALHVEEPTRAEGLAEVLVVNPTNKTS